MDLSKSIKLTPIILVVISMLIGSVYFLEDRYFKVASAKEMRIQIEKASVETFQKQQEKLELEILDIIKSNRRDIERRLEKNPTSIYLKNQLERLIIKIKRLEDKLYNS
ncbi:hypothetical protein LCGC14_2283820 [marine sediment metagenome]|uniref:Uncharacterized protein n=1 Tax=marine sediment metagenome TaxID=412755 RepID=A0A0F9F5S3_9ZZZZ